MKRIKNPNKAIGFYDAAKQARHEEMEFLLGFIQGIIGKRKNVPRKY